MKYTVQEYIVLILCSASVVGITPLLFLRLMGSEWLIASIDGVIVVISCLIALYVIKYRKVRIPSIVLTLLYMLGTALVVQFKGSSLIYWAYPTMVTAYFLLKPGEAVIANIITMLSFLPVLNNELGQIEFFSIVITLVIINIFSFIVYRSMYGYQHQLATLATRDFLTGTGNRRLFDEHVELCISLIKRDNKAASLVVLDIDKFKYINDTYGHGKGDQVLNNIINLIRTRLRESDDLYRIGGDEFAILLRGSDASKAVELGEEFRHLVKSNDDLFPEDDLSISLGVTEIIKTDTPKSLLHRADIALYQAKKTGRNKVCLE